MGYFQALLDQGWSGKPSAEIFVPINVDHFHVILDMIEYGKDAHTNLEKFVPSTVSVASVRGAATFLGLLEAQPTDAASDKGGDILMSNFATLGPQAARHAAVDPF